MKRFVTKLLSAFLALAFTIFWLYVLDWILSAVASHIIWGLPDTPRLIGDVVLGVMSISILVGSIPVTRNNYRAIKQTLLKREELN